MVELLRQKVFRGGVGWANSPYPEMASISVHSFILMHCKPNFLDLDALRTKLDGLRAIVESLPQTPLGKH